LTGVKEGKWIIGVNWNHELWGGEMPEAAWIDAPNHPVSHADSACAIM
jgi:predicted amidohydrolase YtcJ